MPFKCVIGQENQIQFQIKIQVTMQFLLWEIYAKEIHCSAYLFGPIFSSLVYKSSVHATHREERLRITISNYACSLHTVAKHRSTCNKMYWLLHMCYIPTMNVKLSFVYFCLLDVNKVIMQFGIQVRILHGYAANST